MADPIHITADELRHPDTFDLIRAAADYACVSQASTIRAASTASMAAIFQTLPSLLALSLTTRLVRESGVLELRMQIAASEDVWPGADASSDAAWLALQQQCQREAGFAKATAAVVHSGHIPQCCSAIRWPGGCASVVSIAQPLGVHLAAALAGAAPPNGPHQPAAMQSVCVCMSAPHHVPLRLSVAGQASLFCAVLAGTASVHRSLALPPFEWRDAASGELLEAQGGWQVRCGKATLPVWSCLLPAEQQHGEHVLSWCTAVVRRPTHGTPGANVLVDETAASSAPAWLGAKLSQLGVDCCEPKSAPQQLRIPSTEAWAASAHSWPGELRTWTWQVLALPVWILAEERASIAGYISVTVTVLSCSMAWQTQADGWADGILQAMLAVPG